MEAVVLLLFVGCVWVLGVIGLFSWTLFTEHPQHADRLALLPIEDNWQDTQTGEIGRVEARGPGKSQHS